MKRFATILAASALALPLVAQSTTTATTPKKETKPAEKKLDAPPPAATVESPLAAAARRSNRLNKKPAVVITNDTLTKTGHLTEAHTASEIKMPPPLPPVRPTPEMTHAKAVAEEKTREVEAAAAKQKAEEEKRKKMEALAAIYDEVSVAVEGDAVEVEHAMEQTANPSKPPQE